MKHRENTEKTRAETKIFMHLIVKTQYIKQEKWIENIIDKLTVRSKQQPNKRKNELP